MDPSKDWEELIAPDEETRFAQFATQLGEIQRMNASNGRNGRALHTNMRGGFEARLEISGNLPEPARHGLFAQPKTYDALVRYSNGASVRQPDDRKGGDVRGMAVKVLGVDGAKVIGNARTQDFLGILQSSTPFRTPDEFIGVVWAFRGGPLLGLPRLLFGLGPSILPAVKKLSAGINHPVASLATQSFFSALPTKCGPYAMRVAFVPLATPGAGAAGTGPDYLHTDLLTRLRQGPIEYAMEVQFFVDETRTPIEDASVDWPVAVAPYVRVGKLVIPPQDATSERGHRIADAIEGMAFDPWHALADHRPLGAMMRARKAAYFASTKGRSAAPEPEGKIS